jgi:uncharacterized heparinase superfamily protein
VRRASVDRALPLARTTRNLRMSQVLHRARLRAQRWPPSRPVGSALLSLRPSRPAPVKGWPIRFRPLDLVVGDAFPSAEENARGRFTFLNAPRDLGSPVDWHAAGTSRLWGYHLHYMEWAWSFASHPDRQWARQSFAELWRSWSSEAPFGAGDAWSPYVASLRAWVLCGTHEALSAGSATQEALDASLALHARFLRWHVEHDVGGNHLVKNLKALVGLGIFLGDEGLLGKSTAELERQVGLQVLADGGHYERSPSYHCQVLGDFVDVAELLAAAGRPPVPGLADAIDSMRTWLGLMLMPDGDVPLFNDCVLVGRPRLAALRPGPAVSDRLTVLPASGYVVVRPDERLRLVADVGDPCPPDLPAHAHADCLSFELAVDAQRVVVDAGTSTYEPGADRRHERSTAAHNTVTVDGFPSSVPGSPFQWETRAASRVLRWHADGGAAFVEGTHDGYERLAAPATHRRAVLMVGGDAWIVRDVIESAGPHDIAVHWHPAPDLTPRLDAGVMVLERQGNPALGIAAFGADDGPAVADSSVSPRYGHRVTAPILSWTCRGRERAEVVTFLLPVAPGAPAVPHVTELEQSGPGRAFAVRAPAGIDLLLLASGGIVADGHAVDTDAAWLWLRFAPDGELRDWIAIDARQLVVDGQVLLDAAAARAWTTADGTRRGGEPSHTGAGAG